MKGDSGETYRAGTIFVRRPGKTEQAGPADVAALQARAGRSALRLDVALGWQRPIPAIAAVADRTEDVAVYARGERAAMLAAARDVVNPRDPVSARFLIPLDPLLAPETRTLEEFARALDRWVGAVAEVGPRFIRDSTARHTAAWLVPMLTNLTEGNITEVAWRARAYPRCNPTLSGPMVAPWAGRPYTSSRVRLLRNGAQRGNQRRRVRSP